MFDTNATIDPTAQVENDTQVNENFSNEEGKVDETIVVENQVNTEEFKKNPEDDSKDSEVNTEDDSKEDEEDDKKKVTENALDVNDEFAKKEEEEPEEEEKDDKKAEKDYALLEQKYNELQQTYSALEKSYNELVEFKATIENEKKDALIQEFYMLSDEDKKDVVDNKSIYSLEDIEAKLSVICVRKKVNFDLSSDTQSNVEDTAPTTYNLNELEQVDNLPAWLKAVEATKNRNQ